MAKKKWRADQTTVRIAPETGERLAAYCLARGGLKKWKLADSAINRFLDYFEGCRFRVDGKCVLTRLKATCGGTLKTCKHSGYASGELIV